jgi:GTP-binding protein
MSKGKNGRSGVTLEVRVPVGTMVHVDEGEDDDEPVDEQAPRVPEAGTLLGDLTEDGQRLVVASGGRGGRGNVHFVSSTNRSPDRAEPGTPGQALWLRLELKLLADVGIVGFPNVGKSTLIARISRARPKIAEYPFTTLVPNLGVVSLGPDRTMVVADVPGLIRGASEGRGLGLQFLRHLERTRVLVHLLAPDLDPEREPLADLGALEAELAHYGARFEERPRVVALNKADTLADPAGQALIAELRAELRERNIPLFPISAQTGEGVDALLEAIWRRLEAVRRSDP